MKQYLLLHRAGDSVAEQLSLEGRLSEAFSVPEAIQQIEKEEGLSAVLIDTPSSFSDIEQLIQCIDTRKNDLLAFPILILTDSEHLSVDERYLGGSVVDCVVKPLRPAVFKNRLNNAEQLLSSVSFNEFSKMLRSLPANIYLKDDRGRYVFSSQTWHHLNTDNDPNWTIRGKTDLDIRKDKENAQKALESDLNLIRTGKGSSYIIEENDGQQEFLQIIKEPLFYEDGRVRGIIALINIVTEQEQMRRMLRERYITDQLTRVYNRSYYTEYLSQLEKETPRPLSILIADCDHLKMVNDTCGHIAGDDYIRCCAELLRHSLPEGAMVFRTGGDEFAAFLPGVGAEEMEGLLAQLRKEALKYSIDGIRLSVSLGFSTVTEAEPDLKAHIARADQKMYADKQSKRR